MPFEDEEKSRLRCEVECAPQECSSLLLLGLEGKGVYELLPQGHTVTPLISGNSQEGVLEKRPRRPLVHHLHDNYTTRPHVAESIHEKIEDLGWRTVPDLS